MDSPDAPLPDADAIERASAESLAKSARLIRRINGLLADRRRSLDAADRSLARAREVAHSLDLDLNVELDLRDRSSADEATEPLAPHRPSTRP